MTTMTMIDRKNRRENMTTPFRYRWETPQNAAANGAAALISASSCVIGGGQAGVSAAPDNADGGYVVLASASRLSASFHLTNTGPVFANLVVNATIDALAPGAGLLSLREAIGFADDYRSGNTKTTFDKHVFANP
jgi:fibronectin-binding autotransporter adhesin